MSARADVSLGDGIRAIVERLAAAAAEADEGQSGGGTGRGGAKRTRASGAKSASKVKPKPKTRTAAKRRTSREPAQTRRDDEAPTPLAVLVERFGLGAFERDVVLLCAAVELDPEAGEHCATLRGDPALRRASVGVALALLEVPDRRAFAPHAPLESGRLVRVDRRAPFIEAELALDPAVLHFLLEGRFWDEELGALLTACDDARAFVPSHRDLVARAAGALAATIETRATILLRGTDREEGIAIAAEAVVALGGRPYEVAVDALPREPNELAAWCRRWRRFARLSAAVLVLVDDEGARADTDGPRLLRRTLAWIDPPAVVVSSPSRALGLVDAIGFDVPSPTESEQLELWRAVSPVAEDADADERARSEAFAARLVDHFSLSSSGIVAAASAAHAVAAAEGADTETWRAEVWERCRARARGALEGLARRLDAASVGLDDLVVPARTREALDGLLRHVRHRREVLAALTPAARGVHGLGVSALFAGPSGLGKTFAAEALAAELGLDLYRIDLSAVVDKYIGETEKNLRRLFDAAEAGGVVLLFDEADALFGRRAEVRDGHDRHANIEVGYLLQRIEEYCGLAILTTNRKDALDGAFARRLRFVIDFAFPTPVERRALWTRATRGAIELTDDELDRLAAVELSGAQIRTAVIDALCLARADGAVPGLDSVLHAVRAEYVKAGRPLGSAELAAEVAR